MCVGRFAEIVYDVNEGVAVKGVRLVTHLVRAGEMPQDKVLFTPSPAISCLMRHTGNKCATVTDHTY